MLAIGCNLLYPKGVCRGGGGVPLLPLTRIDALV